MEALTPEEVFSTIGNAGFIQIVYISSIGSLQFFVAFHMVMNIFAGLEPHFTCIPTSGYRENLTDMVNMQGNSRMIMDKTNSLFLADLKPQKKVINLKDECPNNDPKNCRLLFNKGYKSFAEEWSLVCNRKYKVAVVQSVWMLGVMSGALFLASFADSHGRMFTLVISIVGLIAFDGLASFASSFSIYVFLRFIAGMMCALVILCSFVLSQELVGSSKRSVSGVFCACTFSVGIILLAFISANINNWRTLTLFTSSIGVLFLCIPFIVPESPMWLLTKGREEEARQVFISIAKGNGKLGDLPDKWKLVLNEPQNTKVDLETYHDDDKKDKSSSKKWLDEQKMKHKKLKKVIDKVEEKSSGVRDLFAHSFIVKLIVVQIFSWFTNSSVYYGLTLAASELGGDVYVSTALNGAVEIPASFLCIFFLDRFGRKKTLIGFLLFGGCSCFLIPICSLLLPTESTATNTTLALLGKLAVSASFSSAYIHSGEIFPTCVRNSGIGILSVAARIGGVVCPFILMLGDVVPHLQFATLGAMAFAAGLLNFILPETLGRPSPQTINDMLAFKDSTELEQPSGSRVKYTHLKTEGYESSSDDENTVVNMQ